MMTEAKAEIREKVYEMVRKFEEDEKVEAFEMVITVSKKSDFLPLNVDVKITV